MEFTINGPKIMFTIPIFGGIPVTETVTTFWGIIVLIWIVSVLLTRNLQKVPKGKQVLLEKAISAIDNLVAGTMGKDKMRFAPYILTMFLASALSSLTGLIGLRQPTADFNTTLGWALVTFVMIHYNGAKSKGFWTHIKGLTEPVAVMTPLNIISEIATPISMSFRHFGNIVAGYVISALLYAGLGALTSALFGGLSIPILAAGIPAVLSLYFDLFGAALQAFIFTMLTMVFVAGAID